MSESEAKDNFGKGIFWELYLDLERQFQSFLEYVPFEGNECTYSYKLLNLILSVGGHIDSAFKEMARYPGFATEETCKKILKILEENRLRVQSGKPLISVPIRLCLEAFETEYRLSSRYVIFKGRPTQHNVSPFVSWGRQRVPEWWETYNGLKHDVGVNLKKANLLTTLNALAGAFLINVIHDPAILMLNDLGMLELGFKRGKSERMPSKDGSRYAIQYMLGRKRPLPFVIQTQLFVYDYEA